MKRKCFVMLAAALMISAACGVSAGAAVSDSATAAAYDAAVDLQDQQNCLDVTVHESTSVPGLKSNTSKTITLKASGLQNLSDLTVSISIETDDGTKDQYYSDGYFYDNESGENIKYAMDPEDMLELMDYYVYLDLNSSLLSDLDAEDGIYNFSATEETLGAYMDNILEGVQSEHQIELVTMQGYIVTNSEDYIVRRCIQTVYNVNSGEETQTCTTNSVCAFSNPGESVTVTLPDLSGYQESKAKEAVVEITEKSATVYATDDLNVRAQNNVTAAILGGIAAGGSIQETGYTSDGWIQIDYNGTTAYVSADYVSDTEPVIVKAMSGTMYATTSVYVRDKAGTDGNVLGVLSTGDSISVSGYTNTDWIRVSYLGNTGYVTRSYLSWDAPVSAMGGTMYVVSAQANIRSYYSTDSDVLGVLSYGTGVTVTGYTSNNWIRVSVGGSTGYIYGNLLSWTDPQSYSCTEQTDDSTYTYNPTDTSSVKQTYGTIVSCGMSTVTIACSNGNTLQFSKEDATVNCPNGIYTGLYVSAVYVYDSSSGTYILQALDAM